MRPRPPPSDPITASPAQASSGAPRLRVVAGDEIGPRIARAPFERVLAALTYRESGGGFLPDFDPAPPTPRARP